MGFKARPSSSQTTRLEFRKGSSNKFWESTVRGSEFTICFGRIGTDGQTTTKKFASAAEAREHAAKAAQGKLKKGYVAPQGGPKQSLKSGAGSQQAAELREVMEKAFVSGDVAAVSKAGLAALAIEPTHPRTLTLTAAALGWQGYQSKKLPKVIEAAAAHVGKDSELLMNLLFVYSYNAYKVPKKRVGLAERAVQSFFDEGGKLPRSNPGPWGNIINTYLAAERFDDALALAKEGIKSHKKPVGYHSLASVHAHRQDRAGVLAAIKAAKKARYDVDQLRGYPAYQFLYGDPEFEALFSRWKKFFAHFGDYQPPLELQLLFGFEWSCNGAEYCDGFTWTIGQKSHIEAAWSKAPEFKARLHLFATADGTGSDYALWAPDGKKNLAKAPVVVLGSEGGLHVVATDAKEFLQLLTWDTETSAWPDGVHYSIQAERDDLDDPYEPSPAAAAYSMWHSWYFGSAQRPEEIVKAAQKRWQKPFKDWFSEFLGAD